ncbi:hypothetical protein [Clostridium sp. 'White wine YQ']|uniref:hypothetical protein n=1 Tax=Clostridium sp. 'White wine YQ' TaxID=3027474 RepID=UPI0023657916|nr:hypothetical protein [Clostridium sp. 'White wine YQ']MDD7792997.1 hypothetical protein [Clostridium sp. 'White wine YQ']
MFYRLFIDEGKRKKYAYGILLNDYPVQRINCGVCNRVWDKDMLLTLKPEFELVLSNDNLPDFLGLLILDLISEKTKQVFEESEITGYKLFKTNCLKKDEISKEKLKSLAEDGFNKNKISNLVQNYYFLDVSIGAELDSKTEIIVQEYCNSCGYVKYRTEGKTFIDPAHPIYIKKASWNGNDIFRIKELGNTIFCTQKIVDLCKEHKLMGIGFEKINFC